MTAVKRTFHFFEIPNLFLFFPSRLVMVTWTDLLIGNQPTNHYDRTSRTIHTHLHTPLSDVDRIFC